MSRGDFFGFKILLLNAFGIFKDAWNKEKKILNIRKS